MAEKVKKPAPTPQPSPTAGTTPSQDVSEADKNAGLDVPTGTGGKQGLTGVPLGTPIIVGEEEPYAGEGRLRGPARKVIARTQYKSGDGMTKLTSMDNQERVNLLSKMAQIPGLYPKNQAPTIDSLRIMAQGGEIGIRDVDARALENVMKYADTVGVTYDMALNRFYNDTSLAAAFFGQATPDKGPRVIDEQSLIAEISDKFQDAFDMKVNKKIAKQYAKEVQQAQIAKGKGGRLSAQERENILLGYLQNAAKERAQLLGEGAVSDTRGVLGQYVQDLREEFYNNGLPIDEQRIYNLAVQSLRSPQEFQNNKQKVQQRAELMWPPLVDYIRRGESVRDVLSPYMKLKADIWEKDMKEINPSDMYDILDGDKLKNVKDYKTMLYQSPEHKKTQAYQEQSISDVRGLLRYLRIG